MAKKHKKVKSAPRCTPKRARRRSSKGVKVWNTKTKGMKWCRRAPGAKKAHCGFKTRKAAKRG